MSQSMGPVPHFVRQISATPAIDPIAVADAPCELALTDSIWLTDKEACYLPRDWVEYLDWSSAQL